MKKANSFILSMITGLFPCWFIGYNISELISELSSSTQMIGNRRMLIYLHPALKLAIAAAITVLILTAWNKLAGVHLERGFNKLREIKLHRPDSESIGTFFTSFFKFGDWRAESIVQFIFYFGVILVGLQIFNMFQFIFFDYTRRAMFGFHTSAPLQGLILVFISIVSLLIWKCVCEILLIILRAFEVYYVKTVDPKGLHEYIKKTANVDNSNNHKESQDEPPVTNQPIRE